MAVRDTEFVRGAEKLAQRIRTIRANLALPAMTAEIGDLLLRRTLTRFDQEIDPDGKPWVPLAPTTIETKLRLGFGGKGKLKRTETLRKSITIIRGNASGSVYTNTGAGVRIGVSSEARAEIARAQNSGTNKIPARRFLGIGALDIKSVDSFLRRRGQKVIDAS